MQRSCTYISYLEMYLHPSFFRSEDYMNFFFSLLIWHDIIVFHYILRQNYFCNFHPMFLFSLSLSIRDHTKFSLCVILLLKATLSSKFTKVLQSALLAKIGEISFSRLTYILNFTLSHMSNHHPRAWLREGSLIILVLHLAELSFIFPQFWY